MVPSANQLSNLELKQNLPKLQILMYFIIFLTC